MGPNDDPAVVAYRKQREARAELAEALENPSFDGVVMMLLQDGPEETLSQLQTAPERINCYGFSIRDEEHRKRLEASLLKLAECAEAYNRATADRKRQEPAYMGGLGRPEAPRVPRRRRRDRSR